jgi:hypothetical protein
MTEAEWLTAREPLVLLSEISAGASRRKLLLFACECCRPLLTTEPAIEHETAKMFEAAELFAEGLIPEERFREHFPHNRPDLYPTYPHDRPDQFFDLHARGSATYLAFKALGPPADDNGWDLDPVTFEHVPRPWQPGEREEELTGRVCLYAGQARAMLAIDYTWSPDGVPDGFYERQEEIESEFATAFREIFGNPFRPVSLDPSWRRSDVLLLAQGIYEEKAFDRMPILADALQDAGCDATQLLDHLRDVNATHVRGCWALDLVLGKE